MSSNPRRTGALAPLDTNVRDGLKLKSNLVLRKGATFHSPVTPPSSPPSGAAFKVPSLPRRSQTNLDDVVGAHVRRAALNIGRFEDSLSSTDTESISSRRSFHDDTLPIPSGFLNHTIVGDKMVMEAPLSDNERRVLRPRTRRSSHHESDSGLGTSIASTVQKRKETKPSVKASTITRSINTSKTESLPRLSSRAVNRIHEHTLQPLLAKPELKDFRPIILDCPRRIQENQIICLRDLEKTLIFMAPVSQLLKDSGVWGVTYRSLCLKERANSAKLYLDFCTTSIRCIQATVEYLSDREQTRPHDRPYNSGYFIDLIEQIRQHATQMQEARDRLASGEDLDEMDVDPTDEVKLIGGLATTGRPAELVRVKKNGKAISLATGEPVDDLDEKSAPIRFKRSMSQQAEDEEEIMRSMARRKKNATPEELAPKKCTHPGCNKEFKRPCDLTKHEKTHSRPWKCPIPTCKFHEYGWPTEKEMARHVNDKHSAAPAMFECEYKPCPYKSKRESNCKQHMEKAHGWTYKRSKVPKTKGSKAGSSAKPTPMLNNLPTPSSDQTDPILTPHEDAFLPTFEDRQDLFPTYPSTEEFNAGLFDNQAFDGDISLDFSPIDNGTPSTDAGQFNNYHELSPEFTGQFEDIYGAPVRLPTPTYSVYNKTMPDALGNFTTAMCPPVPAPHFSPSGQGNTMLYTPISIVDVDEGFDDFHPVGNGQLGGDFTLFPANNMGKPSDLDPTMFCPVPPSLTAGFIQPSSQEFNMDFNMEWASTDMHGFPNQ
ncbi:hypothetical protein NUW58_g3635 [Xylaria curta]|uniref:Uncharacterized protein n=1 Tax=Xylaria curta TaxID=42375 RepID=A0ACC1PCS0_9PEZI|nr:hypothetical protein NUW58_g3635 [Xylaria curta]